MRVYQCHKLVEAAPIIEVGSEFHAEDHDFINITVEGGDVHALPVEAVARYLPVAGDYLVKYRPDGYLSISPKAAFEAGYSLAEEK